MIKKILYFIGLCAYAFGTIGGIGSCFYAHAYAPAIGVTFLAYLAFPEAKKYYHELTSSEKEQ